MPGHDEAAADEGRYILGGVDGDGGGLCAHADAEQDAADEEFPPGLGQAGADDGKEAEDGGEEDGAAAAEVVVQRVAQPAAAEGGGDVRRFNSQKSAAAIEWEYERLGQGKTNQH